MIGMIGRAVRRMGFQSLCGTNHALSFCVYVYQPNLSGSRR